MNYDRLTNKLRMKMYSYSIEKQEQCSRLLIESIKRKCNTLKYINNRNIIEANKENKLLFRLL